MNVKVEMCASVCMYVCIRIQEVAHEWPHVSAPWRTGSVLQLQLAFVPDTVPLSPLSVSLLFVSLSQSLSGDLSKAV